MDTRKQPSRLLATVLSLCMLFTMLPVGSMTAQAAGDVEVISENTAWDVRTISNDVQIASGVTVTVNGAITIDGTVTITGGGTIVRGSGNAYFDINSGNSLTLDGVTVDGDSISSSNSMFDVSGGTLNIKDSIVQNCVKSDTRGGAVNMDGGTLTIENTTIKDCSATGYGGAIYLRNGADATIKSGTFSGNRTTNSSYGGGFIYITEARLPLRAEPSRTILPPAEAGRSITPERVAPRLISAAAFLRAIPAATVVMKGAARFITRPKIRRIPLYIYPAASGSATARQATGRTASISTQAATLSAKCRSARLFGIRSISMWRARKTAPSHRAWRTISLPRRT